MPILAIYSLTISSPVHQEEGFLQWHGYTTDGHCNLETESAQVPQVVSDNELPLIRKEEEQ